MANPEASLLPRELYPDRDAAIRQFCAVVQSQGGPVSPELAQQFFDAVWQISYRAVVKSPSIYPEVTAEDREDIVSQTMIDFWCAVRDKKFVPREGTPLAGYVARAAKWAGLKVVYAYGYKKSRLERAKGDAACEWIGGPQVSQSVQGQIEKQELLREVIQAIQSLSPRQRKVMELLPFYSRDEICEKLKISPNQLRLRIQKARKKNAEQVSGCA